MIREYTILQDGIIQYLENGNLVSIPLDPANSDYQEYLRSLKEKPKKA
jgi:hypothetical protein